ncbi:acyltransferase family protein [Prosthecobacter sp.]|uniref:acyltransferase family protein n=1 Tax=Prosthecobacter sp. TaxID=1965333 RepID=UPI001D5F7FD5|nr:acyltransferase family protein [Prosthecobacter sp.]MCB1275285.1 acyltransferase [Prosthecobacter sp.]
MPQSIDQHPRNEGNYRRDIDGMRGWAVGFVLLHHLGFTAFKGGFIGVDVFFVISGFLITRIIRDEVQATGRFRFSNFFARRARRLFPALFVTLVVAFAVACILFPPQYLARVGGALVYSVASLGNFYFWSEGGYFDVASDLKPLLHTWSLSVEEQFYLVWPGLLVLSLKAKWKWAPLVLLGLTATFSFIGNLALTESNNAFSVTLDPRSTIFYLTPFRAFEFAIGAGVVWLGNLSTSSRILKEVMIFAGLGMIIWPAIGYDTHIPFPSYNALLPCIGAALLIYTGGSRYVGRLLENRLIVGMGLISYSLYLVHWPLIVFYRFQKTANGSQIVVHEMWALILVAVCLAVLMYRFVEKPFRRGAWIQAWPPAQVGFASVLMALLLMLPAASAWASNGWGWRFSTGLSAQLSPNKKDLESYVWEKYNQLEKDFANQGLPKVLVVGDSMAADFVNVLVSSDSVDSIDLRTFPIRHNAAAVFPIPESVYDERLPVESRLCKEQQKNLLKSHMLGEADTVVLASRWQLWHVPYLEKTIQYLKDRGVRHVAVVGRKDVTVPGLHLLNKNTALMLHLKAQQIRTPVDPLTVEVNEMIKAFHSDFRYIDILELFSDSKGCRRFTEDNHLITFDTCHLTPQGAEYLAKKASGTEWMTAITKSK